MGSRYIIHVLEHRTLRTVAQIAFGITFNRRQQGSLNKKCDCSIFSSNVRIWGYVGENGVWEGSAYIVCFIYIYMGLLFYTYGSHIQ